MARQTLQGHPQYICGGVFIRLRHYRTARCYCGREAPSSTSLAFFEYCGPGSRSAEEHCKHCRYHLRAHEHDDSRVLPTSKVERGECPGFEPLGDIGHDRYYCGHRGWD